MIRFPALPVRAVLLAGLIVAPATTAALAAQEHPPMLIDKIPADMWPGQRNVKPTDYPHDQETIRTDVTRFLKGRFRVTGDRLFVIPPDQGIILLGSMFMLGGPSQFQEIHSAPVFDRRPDVRQIMDAQDHTAYSNTSITVGETLSGEKIYTAIALHAINDSKDELIGYFQLVPLVADPTKGF